MRKFKVKIKKQLTPGSVVELYADPEYETNYLCKVELIDREKVSLPFITEETTEATQEVYVLEYWWVTPIDDSAKDLISPVRPHPVRRLYSQGITYYGHRNEDLRRKKEREKRKRDKRQEQYNFALKRELAIESDPLLKKKYQIDKFISYAGKEIY